MGPENAKRLSAAQALVAILNFFFFDTTFDCSSPITIYEILPIGFIANQKLIEVMYVNTVRGVDTTIREKLIRHPPLEGGQLENE